MALVVLDARRNPATVYENVEVALARQYMLEAKAIAEGIEGSAGEIGTALQPGDPVSQLAETASAKIMTSAERSRVAQMFTDLKNLGRLRNWLGSNSRSPLWLDAANNELLGLDAAPSDGASYYRGHMVDWLKSVIPTASTLGVRLKPLGRLVYWSGSATRSPFWLDSINNELLGIDTAPADGVSYYRGHFVDWLRRNLPSSASLAKALAPIARLISWSGAQTRSPFWIDAAGNLLLGANVTPADGVSYYEGHFHDYLLSRGGGGGGAGYTPIPLAAVDKPSLNTSTSILGFVDDGQSLSIGAQGQPPLSTTQPYSNKMLTGGVKGTGTGFVPLVEDSLAEGGASGGNRGETICSSAANYACKLFTLSQGKDPNALVIWASAPGQGGTPIAGLVKGTAPYTRMLTQITNAAAAASALSKQLVIPAVAWIQGETDLTNGNTRAAWLAAILQFLSDINADIPAITGQTAPIHILLGQTCYMSAGTAIANSIQLAQMDAVAASPRIHLVTNYGFLPYNGDKLHSTNVGYNWLGHYFGRALKQLVFDGNKPDCIWPLSATVSPGGTTLTLKYRTPTRLKLNGPVQTNYGFRVTDDTGDLTLSNISVVSSDTVQMTLNRALGSNPKVRYALDYCAANNITGGGLGDLTDSTPDTCVISGTTYSLVHRAPASLLNVYTVEI